jgi:hypothetical protein
VSGDHYIPAAYLGGFSSQTTGSRRHRKIMGLRRGGKNVQRLAAASVAKIQNHYRDLDGLPALQLEKNWQGYERGLPHAIEQLVSGEAVDARTWLHVLVPFVAGMMVRGPDFDLRFSQGFDGMEGFNREEAKTEGLLVDVTPPIRSMELQRLLAATIACRWVVRSSPDLEIVTNDVGWVGSLAQFSERAGIAVALDSRHVLLLVPCDARPLVTWRGAGWEVLLERDAMDGGDALGFNQAMARMAERFIFGGSESAVLSLSQDLEYPRQPRPGPMQSAGYSPFVLAAHEFEWWRLRAAIRKAPTDLATFELEFALPGEDASRHWSPPMIMFPVMNPEFPSGLSFDGRAIWLKLTDAESAEKWALDPETYMRENAGSGA